MGGQESKAKSKIVTEVIVDVLEYEMLNCSEMIQQEQGLNISGSGNVIDGVSMKQAFFIKTSCFQNVNKVLDIQNKIAEEIQQRAAAQGEVIVSALGREKGYVKSVIKNKIANSINQQTITNCASSINNKQMIDVSGNNNIIKNVTMEQHSQMIRDCTQELAKKTELVNDLEIKQSQEASAEEMGLFGWMQSGWGTIVLIAIVVFAFIFLYYKSGGSASMGRPPMRPPMRPPPVAPPMYSPPVTPAYTPPSVTPQQRVQFSNINQRMANLQ